MNRAAAQARILARVIPYTVDLEEGAHLSREDEQVLARHAGDLPEIIQDLIDEAVDAVNPLKRDHVDRVEALIHKSILAVAEILLHFPSFVVNNIGLKIAAIMIGKKGDPKILSKLLDLYEVRVDEQVLAQEERHRAHARDVAFATKPVYFDAPMSQALFCQMLANARMEAGILAPPNTPLGDRLHEQAVLALQVVSTESLSDYQDFVATYGVLGRFSTYYPGVSEILYHSYIVVTDGLQEFIDHVRRQEKGQDVRPLLRNLIYVDSMFISGDFGRKDLNDFARAKLSEHVSGLNDIDPSSTLDVLERIQSIYLDERPSFEVSSGGILKLFACLQPHLDEAARRTALASGTGAEDILPPDAAGKNPILERGFKYTSRQLLLASASSPALLRKRRMGRGLTIEIG